MEYILNETPYKTTNNFKINNIKVDIDIPEITYLKPVNKKLNSKIGLDFDKYDEYIYEVNGNVTEIIDYKDGIGRVININFILPDEELIVGDYKNEFNLVLKSLDESTCFSYIKINNNIDNKDFKLNVINLLNNNSNSFIEYNNTVNNMGGLIINHIDIGGNYKINNLYTELFKDSFNRINTIYIGDGNKLDYNYHIKNIGEESISNIITEGLLMNNSYKQFKGIIDFIEGSNNSEGVEKENCILLDDKSISKSAPLLMCHEENVEGTHSVSTGKIDDSLLFYLMSRGYTEKESKKLIILSNFNKLLTFINDDDIKELISKRLDSIL